MVIDIGLDVAPKIPTQRAHMVNKYVVDNLHDVAFEITRLYGLVPEVNTAEVTEINDGQYELYKYLQGLVEFVG